MDVVRSAVLGWAKTLSSTVQNTKDIKYLDLQGTGGNRDSIFQLKKIRQVGLARFLSVWLSGVLRESVRGSNRK